MMYLKKGYYGEDLHILRNDKPFSFLGLFENLTGLIITCRYKIADRILLSDNTYENISFFQHSVKAKGYVSGPEKEVSCFKVIIRVFLDDPSAVDPLATYEIWVHIHTSISNVWLTPNPIGLRYSIQDIKFKVFAKFNDNIIADISYWSGYVWALSGSAPAFLNIDSNGRIIISSPPTGYPTSFPTTPYSNCITLTLPDYLSYTTVINGSVNVMTDVGDLIFLSGNKNNISDNNNILILGDGFLGSQKSDFIKYANEIVDIFNSDVAKPWNLFKNKINYWAYFLESAENHTPVYGDFIKLNSTHYIDEIIFITTCDAIIGDLTSGRPISDVQSDLQSVLPLLESLIATTIGWTTASGLVTSNVNLSKMINILGFPCDGDCGKTLSVRVSEWNAINGSTPTFMAFSGSIHNFVFKLWMLLYDRVQLSQHDTTWAAAYTSALSRAPQKKGNIHLTNVKFKDKNSFNKYVHNLSYSGTAVGAQFFDSSGNLQKDGDNVIIILPSQRGQLNGENVQHLNSDWTAFAGHISYFAIQNVETELSITVPTTDNIKPSVTSLPTNLDMQVKLCALHEFSHNYLLDEYHNNHNILASSPSIATDYPEFRKSNLQSHASLIHNPPTSTPVGDLIDATKIKWLWPRIRKIGITTSSLTSLGGPVYTVTVGKTYPPKTSMLLFFNVGEKILLRTSDLFGSNTYPRFLITDINMSTGIFTLQYLGSTTLGSFPSGSYIISPIWNPDGVTYLQMVEANIKGRMEQKSFVLIDDTADGHQTINQYPDPTAFPSSYTDPITQLKNPINVSKVVGLWAGGHKYKQGVFHPTGFCLMRGSRNNFLEIADNDALPPLFGNYLCPVCRYILVDAIDPLQHPKIDDSYEKIYPKY